MCSISRNIIAVSICAILCGCTVNNDNKKYATDHVLVDQYGLTLTPSEDMYIDFATISKAYADTMACMGMTATGPIVEFRSFSYAGLGGAWAFYMPAEKTIWINTDEDDIVLKRDSRTDIEALQHEFIHHILHMNGASEQSKGHASSLFKKCGLGVKSNN